MRDTNKPFRRMIFVNLPVADLQRSQAFFRALGFEFNPEFTDENAACLVIEPDAIYSMLLTKPFFDRFTKRAACDTATHTEALIAISCETREAVDQMVATAVASGGAATGIAPQDYGFMYGSSFYDPDGHHWEVLWMADQAAEAGSAGRDQPN